MCHARATPWSSSPLEKLHWQWKQPGAQDKRADFWNNQADVRCDKLGRVLRAKNRVECTALHGVIMAWWSADQHVFLGCKLDRPGDRTQRLPCTGCDLHKTGRPPARQQGWQRWGPKATPDSRWWTVHGCPVAALNALPGMRPRLSNNAGSIQHILQFNANQSRYYN